MWRSPRLRAALLVAILCGAVFLLFVRREALRPLLEVTVTDLALILCLKYAVAWLNGAKLRYLVRFFALRLSYSEWFGLTAATSFHGYLLPARMGIAPRFLYLKRRYGLEYGKQLSLVGVVSLLDLLVTAALGLAATPWVRGDLRVRGVPVGVLLALLCLAALGALILLVLAARLEWRTRVPRLNSIVGQLQEGFGRALRAPRLLGWLLAVILASLLVRGGALWFCFAAVGADADPIAMLLAVCVVNLTILVSLTPGNLGITEGALLLLAGAFQIPLDHSVPAVLLSRAGSMAIQVPLGALHSSLLFGSTRVSTLRDVSDEPGVADPPS